MLTRARVPSLRVPRHHVRDWCGTEWAILDRRARAFTTRLPEYRAVAQRDPRWHPGDRLVVVGTMQYDFARQAMVAVRRWAPGDPEDTSDAWVADEGRGIWIAGPFPASPGVRTTRNQ
jgi:hypothetical protein